MVFFLANFVNGIFYVFKLKQVHMKEWGTIKIVILQGIVLLTFFNLPYKLFMNKPHIMYDTFINSLTETYMLFLNLVLSHAMYATSSSSKFAFYLPKMVICLAVFLGLWAWSYADVREFEAYVKKDFVVDEESRNFEQGCFTFFLLLMMVYSILAVYHSYMALTASSKAIFSRFKNQTGLLVLIVSGCLVSLVVFPFESQTLQFMNENGVVNIYMIVLSYMFSPNTQIDEEIMIDDDGNVSVTPNNMRDLDTSHSADSPSDEISDEQGIEMKTSHY